MAYDAANLEFSETPRIELPVQLDGAQSKVRLLAIIILILEVHFNVQQGYAIEVRVEPESESPERRNITVSPYHHEHGLRKRIFCEGKRRCVE
ncbi:hypothetical protein FQN51_004709 [Onygenales sp. PD_10]|nr:hypothetical protein FQN51_004709 [Onygenales sp. PD_10]